tara:strand:- start:115110 stop:115217 length:108 start_codon:yes stop_codon:yes gene_type:complete
LGAGSPNLVIVPNASKRIASVVPNIEIAKQLTLLA